MHPKETKRKEFLSFYAFKDSSYM